MQNNCWTTDDNMTLNDSCEKLDWLLHEVWDLLKTGIDISSNICHSSGSDINYIEIFLLVWVWWTPLEGNLPQGIFTVAYISPDGEGSNIQVIRTEIFFSLEKCKISYGLLLRRNIYGNFLPILWVEKIVSFAFSRHKLPSMDLLLLQKWARHWEANISRTWQKQNQRNSI